MNPALCRNGDAFLLKFFVRTYTEVTSPTLRCFVSSEQGKRPFSCTKVATRPLSRTGFLYDADEGNDTVYGAIDADARAACSDVDRA